MTLLTGLINRDFLLYCYYGGMCYVGLRKYADAAELFLHAITAPASAMSAVVGRCKLTPLLTTPAFQHCFILLFYL